MSSHELPFEVVDSPDRVTYRLPRQPSGPLAIVGGFLVIFALVVLGMGTMFVGLVTGFSAKVNGAGLRYFAPVLLFFTIILLCFLAIGFAVLFFGLYLIAGRDEIVLDPSHLASVMIAGPFRWSRRVRRERIRQFTVVESMASSDVHSTQVFHGATHTLRVEVEDGRARALLRPYPHECIRALADDLANRCKTMPIDSLDIQAVPASVAVNEESDVPTEIRDREEQPSSSSAIVEQTAGGLRIELPAKGFWRGSPIFAKVFVFFWCTIVGLLITVFTATALAGGKAGKGPGNPPSNVFLVLFFTPFVLVGLGGILGLVHSGRKRAEFVATRTRLAIERWEWFRTKRQEWDREDLKAIHVGVETRASGEDSTRLVNTLVIEPKSGKPVLLLAEREKAELEWLATTLRSELGCPAE
jgi:hypothetical protein